MKSIASAHWEGGLKDGKGTISASGGAFSNAPYSFVRRFEGGSTGTTPEELIAAAHASCFSMALAAALEKNGTPSTSIETTASATLEKVGDAMTITTMQLNTVGVVPNVDDATFQRLAAATKDGCIVSRALKGNMEFKLTATLRSA